MGQNAGPENPSQAERIDPSSVAHHLRVAADKYHETARILLEGMDEAIQALPDEQKPAHRQTRKALSKTLDDQAQDAIRLAHIFEGLEACELNASCIVACVNACDGINPEAVPKLLEYAKLAQEATHALCSDNMEQFCRKHKIENGANVGLWLTLKRDAAIALAEGGHEASILDRISREACAATRQALAAASSSTSEATRNEQATEGVPATDHVACENDGSLQHLPGPAAYRGNELGIYPVGGGR